MVIGKQGLGFVMCILDFVVIDSAKCMCLKVACGTVGFVFTLLSKCEHTKYK